MKNKSIKHYKVRSIARLIGAILLTLGLLNTGCNFFENKMPSDSMLEKIFVEHRNDFEKLVQMSNEDKKVTRIAYDFTWISGQKNIGETGKDRPIGFSKERWDAYKTLFKTLELEAGIVRTGEGNRISFIAYTHGLSVSGFVKGYIYSEDPLSCSNEPMDDLKTMGNKKFMCKKIDENWYIYVSR